nr:mannan endo-1,4-beta-mannosidase 2 isoform X2 [Ipomoea batatas]
MGLVAELYYLLWVRRRIRDRETEGEYTSIGSDIAYLFCCKKYNSFTFVNQVYACMGLNFVEFNCFCIGTFQFAEDAATCIPWGATGAWAFNDGAYNALQISPGKFDEKVFTTVLTRKNTFTGIEYRDDPTIFAFLISFLVNSDFAAYEIKWEGKFNALSSNIKKLEHELKGGER